ncbi:hypothetical protein DRN63_00095 [Nanoarchaeota archaeon]|nr:MAG: hypothetical protein DRN63_00095 [Nanoarchaeota archaeon]
MRWRIIVSSILCLILAALPVYAMDMYSVGYDAGKKGLEYLNISKGDPNLLVLTNAGYSTIESEETVLAIDGVSDSTGCTIGKENLILVHNNELKPLWFAFFRKDTGDCVYIEYSPEEYISKGNIKAELLLNNPEEWQKKMKSKVFHGNEFSIVTISSLWAIGAPYHLLKSAEFHNHICPGLISGYMIAKYLEKNLPLRKGEKYQIIASPPWCKDDAIQIMLDSTVGKRGMSVKQLSKLQQKSLPNFAGIYIRTSKTYGEGDAAVLKFDWDKAAKLCDVNRSYFKDFKSYKWWWARLKMNICLMSYLDKPEEFVSTVKTFHLSADQHYKLHTAGVNPYEELGFIKGYIKEKGSSWTWTWICAGICAGLVVGFLVGYFLKRR